MDFETCFNNSSSILMEGAIGERLKREYNIVFDDNVAMAGLVYDSNARQAMTSIFREYMTIGKKYSLPIIVTTPTRRANKDRVRQSSFDERIIKDNVLFLKQMRIDINKDVFIGGLMGCKGDAYRATEVLAVDEAHRFHSWQADLFRDSKVDFLYAGIMPALSEAIGMARAMEDTALPYIISFMIKSDGKLIDGTTIHDAISTIDSATLQKPICYMSNCVHPLVLAEALSWSFNKTEVIKTRFQGIQANASPLSPEQLDNCWDLRSSDSISLACDMMELKKYFTPKIYGGCCGTDNAHIEEIAKRLRRKLK